MRTAGLGRVGLLGTLPTMRSKDLARRYRERFGVEVVAPPDKDAAEVGRIIFDELVRRDLRPASKAADLRIAQDLRRAGAQGVNLGCTEIFLRMDDADLPSLPVLNTTALPVQALANVAPG